MTDERATVDYPSFDEWVEARVAALLRCAYLVTGPAAPPGRDVCVDDHPAHVRVGVGRPAAADIATGDAVWRVCAMLPPQQRAAVVLRVYFIGPLG